MLRPVALGTRPRFALMGSFLILGLALATAGCQPSTAGPAADHAGFDVRIAPELTTEPLTGRLILMFAAPDSESEPRNQVGPRLGAIPVFGVDVRNHDSAEPIHVSGDTFGFPIESLAELPDGEYRVQALFHHYETFNLANGKTVELPMDRGEGQQWRTAPGNFFNDPVTMTIDASVGAAPEIELDRVNPPIDPPADTAFIKHVKMKSDLLSEFWGRDMYLGANVLLPWGFLDHPEARYPLAIFHGHFPYTFGGFRTEPPDPDLEPDWSDRFHVAGYNIIQQQEAYDFYHYWTAPDTPRMLIIEVQHANPYYDDSYAVNSANLGPYGDAITYELVPFIEEKFRGLGEGWARFTWGGSTGGWEALAVQVKYPDEYNGCFAACPDPIDFRAYMTVDIYEDENAYFYDSKFKRQERPGWRNTWGDVEASVRDFNMVELALGSNGRSGDQMDVWQAVYSPMGDDGYPKPIWNKMTGEIDKEVALYWRENYDLRYIMERDWATLGPKLEGKIHIYCGDMDNYYLNNAVVLTEEFLESTTDPYYDGEVDYGDRAEHCWNGDQENPNHISRLRYNSMYMPKVMQRIKESAPPGADTTSWRY